jgi:hypothetical protein
VALVPQQQDHDVGSGSITGQESQDKDQKKGVDIAETHEHRTMDQMAAEEKEECETAQVGARAWRGHIRVFFCCFARQQR